LDRKAIEIFLRQTRIEDRTKRTWGLGTVIATATIGAMQTLGTLETANDQLLVSMPEATVLPLVAEVIGKMSRAMKDPAEFGAQNAAFCVLTGQRPLGQRTLPSLIFVVVKSLSENSTHVLLEGYSHDLAGSVAKREVKRILTALSSRIGTVLSEDHG